MCAMIYHNNPGIVRMAGDSLLLSVGGDQELVLEDVICTGLKIDMTQDIAGYYYGLAAYTPQAKVTAEFISNAYSPRSQMAYDPFSDVTILELYEAIRRKIAERTKCPK